MEEVTPMSDDEEEEYADKIYHTYSPWFNCSCIKTDMMRFRVSTGGEILVQFQTKNPSLHTSIFLSDEASSGLIKWLMKHGSIME